MEGVYCSYCIRCHTFTKVAESQIVAAFSPGLRVESSFRARSSSGKLSALLLGQRRVCRPPHHHRPICAPAHRANCLKRAQAMAVAWKAPQPPQQRVQRHLVSHTAARGARRGSVFARECNHHGAIGLPSAAYALPPSSQDPHRTVASEQSQRTQGKGSGESVARGQSAAINGI